MSDHFFLSWLTQNGANPKISDGSFNGILPLCVWKSSFACMKLLLAHGAVPDNKAIYWTISRRAIEDPDRLPILSLLLHNSGDVNALETEPNWQMQRPAGASRHIARTSPLYIAAEQGDLEVVKILLERGADSHKRNLTHWRKMGFIETFSEPNGMRISRNEDVREFAKDRFGPSTREDADERRERNKPLMSRPGKMPRGSGDRRTMKMAGRRTKHQGILEEFNSAGSI
ncbi:hypothetical protein K469DRAFT_235702 [Zopfia rhizophila CBS 207.26]|uniref:Uncharacterized protein n=1 Tax=Zopfia rhizophila CBS 207.26 TaxID=1314779 RepID=A0A6A6ERK4_9PEZI|nr:hypothetical protein K469DRAFT_235702 [Zopfia rhizophila CBS 207.26]